MRLAFVALGSIAVTVAACQLIAGIDDRSVAPTVTPDARSDGRPIDLCVHAIPPEAGAGPDGPDIAEPLVLALDLSLTDRVDATGRTPGFDLDGVCSADSGATDSCRRCGYPDSDDPQGRDNAVGRLLPVFRNLAGPSADAGPNHRFRLLAELSRYNGTDNDPDVTVAFYRSHGAEPVSATASTVPREDGGDTWSFTKDSLAPGGLAPALRIERAAVVDRRIVALVTDADPVGRSGLPIDLAGTLGGSTPDTRTRLSIRNAVVSIAIPRDEGSVVSEGVIAGRWNANDLLASLLPIKVNGEPGCKPLVDFARTLVCPAMDVVTLAQIDRTGAACDALSIVFDARAVRARRGSAFELPPLVDDCDAGPVTECEAYVAEPTNCVK